MVGKIWTFGILISLVMTVITGRWTPVGEAMLTAGTEAIRLTASLGASMILWGGLMEILHSAGDTARLAKLMQRAASPLMGGLRDEGCWEAMGMNLAANLLGLGNAATPAGILAAQRLAQHGETGMRALTMLLVLNNAGLTILPTTVIALRQAAGSAEPASTWLPSMAAGVVSAAVGVAVLLALRRREMRMA